MIDRYDQSNNESGELEPYLDGILDEDGQTSCLGRPEDLKGQPIGMYHCEYCGVMVVAGMPHPTDAAVRFVGLDPYTQERAEPPYDLDGDVDVEQMTHMEDDSCCPGGHQSSDEG